MLCHSVVHDCLRCHALKPARLLCPWASPGSDTGVGCHFLLQRIFPTQGWNPCLLRLLQWQTDSLPLSHLGSPYPTTVSYNHVVPCIPSAYLYYNWKFIPFSTFLQSRLIPPYYPQHLVTTSPIYFSETFCLIFHIHVNKIIWYFSFSAWLVSLGIMPLRFICVTNGFLDSMTE